MTITLEQVVESALGMFGELEPLSTKDYTSKIEHAGWFAERVTRWYEAALEQMEYCPFCGMSKSPHGDRCPMALIVEKDTVFVE